MISGFGDVLVSGFGSKVSKAQFSVIVGVSLVAMAIIAASRSKSNTEKMKKTFIDFSLCTGQKNNLMKRTR